MRDPPASEYTVTASIVQHVQRFANGSMTGTGESPLAIPNYRQQKKQREQAKKKKKDEKLLRKGKAPVLNEPEQQK